MEPSSANTGFFQLPPVLRNQFHDDASLRRIFKLFLPRSVIDQVEPEIAQLGDDVLSPQIFSWVTDAERNQPYLRGSGRDIFGRPQNEVALTEGWRKLQEFGLRKGFVAYNYDTDLGEYTRIVQFLRLHLWEASSANTTCPSAMQDGAARLLQRHLAKQELDPLLRGVFQNAFDHLISRDPERAWTSGQWMTERSGGSDVSRTETVATQVPDEGAGGGVADASEGTPLGPWSITGFKWFTSAVDSQMAVLLARTAPGKGLSAFFAPTRRHNPSINTYTTTAAATAAAKGRGGGSELNGITLQRLKSKLGTQSLPTAELELRGMRGWLVGAEGRGIREISTVLDITRLHSALTGLGYLGRSLGVARAYARVREVGAGKGRRLVLARHPLHVRSLANLAGDYHALMLLVFYTISVLGLDERGRRSQSRPKSTRSQQPPLLAALCPPPHRVGPLLRVLSSLHKCYACETTIPLLFGAVAALGGLGYLTAGTSGESEPLNVARLFRDACVLPIWEGTTDVLASDALRALKHPVGGRETVDALDWLVTTGISSIKSGDGDGDGDGGGDGDVAAVLAREWAALRGRIVDESQEALLPEARGLVYRIAEVISAVLFLADVNAADGGGGLPAQVMCRRWLVKKGFLAGDDGRDSVSLETDLEIVYGPGGVGDGGLGGSKL